MNSQLISYTSQTHAKKIVLFYEIQEQTRMVEPRLKLRQITTNKTNNIYFAEYLLLSFKGIVFIW